jgi:8-amino-7-oxononanoate synthase
VTKTHELSAALADLESQGLYRRRRVVQEWPAEGGGTLAVVDGERRVVFCSNDYLGLAHHPAVAAALSAAAVRYGAGSGAAHLVTGHSHEHHALEEELADFTGRQRALLFSTGYMANLGVASALLERGDAVFEDRLNHASLLDAGLLSGARFTRYAHNDVAALSSKLAAVSSGRRLIMSDTVFSMDGDIAPLATLAQTAQAHDAWLMVDDAHGFGVLGAHGGGALQAAGLTDKQVPILMATLGKALGSYGAFVAGDAALIEWLIQKARTYIYTTASPPALAAATRAALALCRSEAWRRERVLTLTNRLRTGLHAHGLPLGDSLTPIQPLLAGSAARALGLSAALWKRGFWVAAIRPPTVPQGSARLRITLSAAHTEAQIDALISAVAESWATVPNELT